MEVGYWGILFSLTYVSFRHFNSYATAVATISRTPLSTKPCVSKPLMPGSNLKAFTGLECRVAIEFSRMGHFRGIGL